MMYLCVHKCSVKLMKTWNYLCGRKLYVSCFSMYVCPVVLNILCYKETILTSKSTYYCTSQKLNNASRNLDYLIANLHEKHKYKDKTGTNYKKKTEKLLKCHPKMFQPKVDKACDDKLVTLLMMNEPEKAAGELEYYSIASLYPSKKTLKRLVKVLTSKGNVEEVRKIQVICEQVYPNECKWNIGFRHYVAEALWRNEQYEASVQLFESILFEYPHKRIKVSNMITCLTDHLIERNLEKELDLLVEMVKHCDINHVVADVWKRLFLSDLVRHQRMGQSILDEYPNVKVCVCRHFRKYNIYSKRVTVHQYSSEIGRSELTTGNSIVLFRSL
ncbi:uncharacterized protein LOC111088702 [Limulus polyphemus]|uniref:Uncharacterized protein LOC111088702 n=1 Tax=Limulus polyphemus TaxID=6850 RepID=A0ABM1TH65_LIMPO|nr:uncharacterized protein LOC111088702 [Limulus polyphemus]